MRLSITLGIFLGALIVVQGENNKGVFPAPAALEEPRTSPTPTPTPTTVIPDHQPRSGTASLDVVWYGDILLEAHDDQAPNIQLVSVSLESRGSVRVFVSDPRMPRYEWPADLETSIWSMNGTGILEIDLSDRRLNHTNVLRVGVRGILSVPISFRLTSCRSKRLFMDSSVFIQETVPNNDYAFYHVFHDTSSHLEISVVPLGSPPAKPFVYLSRTEIAPTRDMSSSQVPWKYEEGKGEHTITIKDPLGPYYIGVYGHAGGAFKIRSRVIEEDDDFPPLPNTRTLILIAGTVLLTVIVLCVIRAGKKGCRKTQTVAPTPDPPCSFNVGP